MTSRYRGALLTAAIVGFVLAAGWLAYQPALSGTFLLDDLSNLGDLEHVDDADSALRFVLSGSAGPVGRPLALATFALQAGQWEQGAGPFLAVNIAIHLLNACLLGSFLYFLTRARGIAAAESRYVAIVAMSLWLFMPLLASSSLMVVQRMATLSATFVLLGLNGYLLARGSLERSPGRALWGMSAALVIATMLALLSKESGALLPVLVLVAEATILSRPAAISARSWNAWASVFLGLPTVLILGYVASRVPYDESLVLMRGFGGLERLLTETRILWEYLLNAFVPRPGQYGPFHDAYPVAGTWKSAITLVSVAGWATIIILAVAWRRKHPLYAFAALWFVGGHLLESTTIALELYFEHRNYVAIMGPVYALCASVLSLSQRYQRAVQIGLPLYVAVSAFFLFSITSLYGNPAQAAAYWGQHYSSSPRAVTSLAAQQLAFEGPGATVVTLNEFARQHPEYAYVGIPALSLSCIIGPSEDHSEKAAALVNTLPVIDFSYQVSNMLSDLLTTVNRVPCMGLDNDTVEAMANAVILNPRYGNSRGYRQLHHQLMARIQRQRGDTAGTLEHLEKAMAIESTTDLNMMIVTTLVSTGRFDEAKGFITHARTNAPLHPLKRKLWSLSLDELQTYVEKSEEAASTDAGPGTGQTS